MTKRNRSKAELEAVRKHREGVEFMKKIGSEKLAPFLVKHDVTMHKAEQTIEILHALILGQQNRHWADKKMSELGLLEELTKDKDAQDRELYQDILTAIDDLGISDTLKVLEFYKRILDMYAAKQVLSAKFAELPIDEILK